MEGLSNEGPSSACSPRRGSDTLAGVSEATTPKRRPGGRSARVREAVLRAALEQILERGYGGLSVVDVAKAAGVADTTVYRRWPTKAELAAAALGEMAAEENPLPDTGTLEGDLRVLLEQILELLRRPEVARIVRAAATFDSEDLDAETRFAYWRRRFTGSSEVVTRAIARGEVPEGTDGEALLEFLVAPAYLRLLLTGEPLDDALVEDSVRRTLAAFTPDRAA